MPRTRLGLLVLSVALSGVSCQRAVAPETVRSAPEPPPKLFAAAVRFEVPGQEMAKLPLEKTREVVQLRQLVKPDRRFLGAAAEVAAIAGAKPQRLTASWRAGAWALDVDGRSLGTIPALPSFGEVLAVLRREASELAPRLGARKPAVMTAERTFLSYDLFSSEPTGALHEAERSWSRGEHGREVLAAAGSALTALAIQSIDRVDVSDPLYARALAVLAARQAWMGEEALEDAAVLASLMGYASEAAELAKRLPPGSLVEAFLTKRLPPLREAAERKDAKPAAKFLFLLRFGEHASMAEWGDWLERYSDPSAAGLPLYRAAMTVHDFGPDRQNAELLLHAVMAQVTGPNDSPRFWGKFYSDLLGRSKTLEVIELLSLLGPAESGPSRGILERFERGLASAVPEKGILAGGEPERAWYRSFFYSALYGMGEYELDRRSSASDAVAFAEMLDDAKSGPASDFRRWFLDVARVKEDQRNLDALIADVGSMPWLGQPAIQRAMDDSIRLLPYNDGRRKRLVQDYVSRIDTRGGGRSGMTNVCWVEWLDLQCFETYRVGAGRLGVGNGIGDDPGYALYLDDRGAIRQMAEDEDRPVYVREAALNTLFDRGWLAEPDVTRIYGALYRLDPLIFHSYVRYLEKRGKLHEAESVIRDRIANERDEKPLANAYNAQMLAGNLEKQGRFEDAWRVVEPWIETWKGDVMDTAASILESRGHHEEAIELARKCLQRYPDAILTRGDVAKILWRQGRYAEVPELFSDPKHSPGPRDWSDEFATDFAEIFKSRSSEDAQKAFHPLLEANFNPWYLMEFSTAMAKADRYDAAFLLLTDLIQKRPGIGKSALDPTLNVYRYLREAKGEPAAIAWMGKTVTEDIREYVLEVAFNQRELPLFWSLLPPAERSSEHVWFLEAAAVALRPETSGDRRETVVAHFRDGAGAGGEYGRHMLGLADEGQVFHAAASVPANRGDAAYALGLRAILDGRYAEASDWFHVCRQIDHASSFSRRGADAVLNRWLADAHPMAMLAERKIY